MSRLRISTNDPNRAISLRDYLSQHGLNVIMLSSTELEIEAGEISEELRNEISSWRHADDLEVTVDALPQTSESAEQFDAELESFDAPQREFILAPYWRKARIKAAGLGAALGTRREQARRGINQLTKRLHETEEKILAQSRKGDQERQIAEEKTWAETVQTVESIQRPELPRTPPIPLRERFQPLRERFQPLAASLVALNSRFRLKDSGKAVAFAGGVVMAGLIGIGLSVSHVDKSSAATIHSSIESSAAAATLQTSAPPQTQPKTVVPLHTEGVRSPKPSPDQMAKKQRRSPEVVSHRYADDAGEDGPEVVTHYYHQKAATQAQKTTYKGVKHYSDMD